MNDEPTEATAGGDSPDDSVPEDSDESPPEDPDGTGTTAAVVTPGRKETLLWAVIGGLVFLVLVQGYELLAAGRVTLWAKFGVAALVAAVTAVATRATRRRVLAENENP